MSVSDKKRSFFIFGHCYLLTGQEVSSVKPNVNAQKQSHLERLTYSNLLIQHQYNHITPLIIFNPFPLHPFFLVTQNMELLGVVWTVGNYRNYSP